jgi:hypothetical protein
MDVDYLFQLYNGLLAWIIFIMWEEEMTFSYHVRSQPIPHLDEK